MYSINLANYGLLYSYSTLTGWLEILFLLSWWRACTQQRMHLSEMQELIFPCLQPGQMIHRKMWFTLGTKEIWFMQRVKDWKQRNTVKNKKIKKKYYCCFTSKASLNKMARETMNGWNNVIIDKIAGKNHKENVFQFCQAASLVTLALHLSFYLKTHCFV